MLRVKEGSICPCLQPIPGSPLWRQPGRSTASSLPCPPRCRRSAPGRAGLSGSPGRSGAGRWCWSAGIPHTAHRWERGQRSAERTSQHYPNSSPCLRPPSRCCLPPPFSTGAAFPSATSLVVAPRMASISTHRSRVRAEFGAGVPAWLLEEDVSPSEASSPAHRQRST